MNQEAVQQTYELINNPILRLLVYFLSAAVVGLSGTCVYLYRDRVSLGKEMILMNQEITRAHTQLAAALEGMREEMQELRTTIVSHLLKSKT